MAFQLHFEFGSLAKPISEQLSDFGIQVDEELSTDCWHWDEDGNAIQRLSIRSIITGSQRDAAIKKLMKEIERKLIAGQYLVKAEAD